MSVAPVHRPSGGPPPGSGNGPLLGQADRTQAIFGSFDGMTSTLGVVAGLLATKSNAPHIGMEAGQYLSDCNRNVRKAVVMAIATLIGSVLPAVPFIFGTSLACVLVSVAITLAAAAVIGHYRGYVVSYAILVVVSVLTVGLSIAVA